MPSHEPTMPPSAASLSRRSILQLAGVAAAVGPLAPGRALAQASGPPPAPQRAITQLAGPVYRFQNNRHFSIFVATPDGIIATDPINAGAATWLKGELGRRFGTPVKYLVYSHDHADHISGGEVFQDTAMVVAHDDAKAAIVGEKRPTAVPQLTFSDRATLELGGTVVELLWVGRNHSNNSIVMRLPRERLLFAVDFIPVESVAFRDFPDAYIPDWIESLRRVEALEFDVLVPGHGPVGKKEHVAMFRQYLEELRAEVLGHARAGRSVEETKQLVKLPKYEKWGGYEQMFALNVEGMYRHVQMHRRDNPRG